MRAIEQLSKATERLEHIGNASRRFSETYQGIVANWESGAAQEEIVEAIADALESLSDEIDENTLRISEHVKEATEELGAQVAGLPPLGKNLVRETLTRFRERLARMEASAEEVTGAIRTQLEVPGHQRATAARAQAISSFSGAAHMAARCCSAVDGLLEGLDE